jgi:glucose/arabinose dehydrogenase
VSAILIGRIARDENGVACRARGVNRLVPIVLVTGLLAGCGGSSGAGEERAAPETATRADPTAASPERSETSSAATYSFRRVLRASSPVHLAAPTNKRGWLYVVEQSGRIRLAVNGRYRRAPFLDIRRLVDAGGERGLLSVAFHPDFAKNRRFFVNYTDVNGNTRVAEYRTNAPGTRALTRTRKQWLFVRQPYSNHNGGQLAFGPDGKLYVGMGDGGAGGDPEDRAQDLRTLLGKLVRIDVGVARPRPQIAALGLRNPWRFSFDRATGDLYVADVGQNAWEEIDFVPRSRVGELANYGWDAFEGRARFEAKAPNPRGRLVGPVHVYGRNEGCSVTGGFVYRGSAVPAAVGRYFFGDFCSGTIWSLVVSDGRAADVRKESFRIPNLSSFGEDARGELYATSLSGGVYRLVR